MTTKGWTPVRCGPRYCSPRCGGGCTYNEFLSAGRKAKALAQKLGPRWSTFVWENLGWHYSVHSPCGRVKVHCNNGYNYTAFLGEPDSGGGRWAESRDTPEAAIRAVVESATIDLHKIGARLFDLDTTLQIASRTQTMKARGRRGRPVIGPRSTPLPSPEKDT